MSDTNENRTHEQKARELFMEGYNCTQAVVGAFCDDMNVDLGTALRMASPLGGGMGKLREVCGSVSGMFLVLGYFYGYSQPADYEGKKELYARVQELARRFREENGSIVCRELLGLDKSASVPVPELRTAEYYRKRPCPDLCACAARILEDYMAECPPSAAP